MWTQAGPPALPLSAGMTKVEGVVLIQEEHILTWGGVHLCFLSLKTIEGREEVRSRD